MTIWRRRRDIDDFSDEVRAHLEHEAAELRAAGMSAEDARAEALRRFGNATPARERVYEAHPLRWIEVLWQDMKFGVRLMRRSPAFTVAAAVVLSLGIGANTALFSIVNALFFKPLPVERPEELFYLYYRNEAGQVLPSFGGNTFDLFLNRTADLADYTGHSSQTVRVAVDNETDMVAAEMVLGNYFDLLGVKMALGRPITVQDDTPSATE